jgi:hypothetical protein
VPLCPARSRLGRQLDFERVRGRLERSARLLLFFEERTPRLTARMVVPAHASHGGVGFSSSGLSLRHPQASLIRTGAPILEVLDLRGVGRGRSNGRGDRLLGPTWPWAASRDEKDHTAKAGVEMEVESARHDEILIGTIPPSIGNRGAEIE